MNSSSRRANHWQHQQQERNELQLQQRQQENPCSSSRDSSRGRSSSILQQQRQEQLQRKSLIRVLLTKLQFQMICLTQTEQGLSRVQVKRKRQLWMQVYGFNPKLYEVWVVKLKRVYDRAHKNGLKCDLTFPQYLRLARMAGFRNPTAIGRNIQSYQLARPTDSGPYSWGTCRFVRMRQNIDEKVKNGGSARAREGKLEWIRCNPEKYEQTKLKISQALKGVKKPPSKLRGRTRDNYANLQRSGDANSKPFVLISPEGYQYTDADFTLKTLCKQFQLNLKAVREVLRGVRNHHKHWTGQWSGPKRYVRTS